MIAQLETLKSTSLTRLPRSLIYLELSPRSAHWIESKIGRVVARFCRRAAVGGRRVCTVSRCVHINAKSELFGTVGGEGGGLVGSKGE